MMVGRHECGSADGDLGGGLGEGEVTGWFWRSAVAGRFWQGAGDGRGVLVAEQLRLMAVHAHPDDESSKGAATMARYVAEGVDVLVATCTGGERGSVLNPKLDRP